MLEEPIVQLLILLLAAVVVVAVFQRLRVPSTLGYLLVGVVLGPYTPGPVVEGHQLRLIAEFGVAEATLQQVDAGAFGRYWDAVVEPLIALSIAMVPWAWAAPAPSWSSRRATRVTSRCT